MENRINDLCAFLDASHSVYHAQARLREQLEAAGYESLPSTGIGSFGAEGSTMSIGAVPR